MTDWVEKESLSDLGRLLSQKLEDTIMTYDDGGRLEAGYKGLGAGDCGARSVAIALQIPYKQAYLELARTNKEFGFKRSARDGIHKPVFEHFLKKHGWSWRSSPKFDGRKARCSDMPRGRVIASQAHHYVAVVDGVPHDIWDCSKRMVYGYYAPCNTEGKPNG